jgi:hypothetical protein
MTQEGTGAKPKKPKKMVKQTVPSQTYASVSTKIPENENITIHINQEKSSHPKIANWISAISASISFGLGIITLLLFLQTKKATQSSIDAATIAKQTFEASREYNKESLRLQKATLDSSTESGKQSFNLQKDALNENHTQFIKESEPYIEVLNVELIDFRANMVPSIKCLIVNLKQTPVKMISKKSRIFDNANEKVLYDTIKLHKDRSSMTQYMVQNSPIEVSYSLGSAIKSTDIPFYTVGKYYFYLAIEIKYQNLVTKKYRYYKALLKIKPLADGRTYPEFLYDENTD